MEFVRTRSKAKRKTKAILRYMIKEQEIKPVGKVLEAEATEAFAIRGQYVYLTFDGAPQQDSYLVVQKLGYTKPRSRWAEVKGPFGYSYKILGKVSLQGSLNIKKKANTYRAIVDKSFDPIAQGSLLIPGELQSFSTSSGGGSLSSVTGQIIGGSFSNTSKILTRGMFAFVNRGEVDGLELDLSLIHI